MGRHEECAQARAEYTETKPYLHQRKYVEQWSKREAVGLIAEMGTGKTYMIIHDMAEKYLEGLCTDVLIFAPNGVKSTWALDEIPKHMPLYVKRKVVVWHSTASKRQKKDLESLFDTHDRENSLRILIMNWESISFKKGIDFAKRFCQTSSRLMIVCDESDSVKSPTANRTHNLLSLKNYANYRRIMTGTFLDKPFDVFTQLSFLDEHVLGTTSFMAFKTEYADFKDEKSGYIKAIIKNRGKKCKSMKNTIVSSYKNLDKLHKIINSCCYRVLKKNCLDLPEKVYKTLYFGLTKQQQKVYARARDELRIQHGDIEEGDIFEKIVIFSKLAQITSGYFTFPGEKSPIRIEGDTPKLDIMEETALNILKTGRKIVIWARFRVEIDDIVKRLHSHGVPLVQYHGGVKDEDRISAVKDFQEGDAKVFVATPAAAGTGLTLVAASYVIYFSNGFSLRQRLQSEDRCHRIGQKNTVTYIDIAAVDTIDVKAIKTLQEKKQLAGEIIDGVSEEVIHLSERDQKGFLRSLDNPPHPNYNLLKAKEIYDIHNFYDI